MVVGAIIDKYILCYTCTGICLHKKYKNMSIGELLCFIFSMFFIFLLFFFYINIIENLSFSPIQIFMDTNSTPHIIQCIYAFII